MTMWIVSIAALETESNNFAVDIVESQRRITRKYFLLR